jgi:hypothetical protein
MQKFASKLSVRRVESGDWLSDISVNLATYQACLGQIIGAVLCSEISILHFWRDHLK